MKVLTAFCSFTLLATGLAGSAFAAVQQQGYVLRDTTSLPSPAAGKARLVVARDMQNTKDMKPEFLFVDTIPIGFLPPKTAVTAEVEPGWHRVWLGRGGKASVWMEFAPDSRYLLRLREVSVDGSWRGDLVREAAEGYAQFALGREMKLAVVDSAGLGALQRNLMQPGNAKARQDSTGRKHAIAGAVLPIEIAETWYLPFPSDAHAGEYQNHPGKLTLDATSLRYTRADATVVEIPRADITDVRFGNSRDGLVNVWIKIAYRKNGTGETAIFADSQRTTSTANYNRLFAELEKGLATQ